MDEFDLIKTYFAPLASGFSGSLNLSDDAAILDVPAGRELVVTTDAINQGIHFIGSEDPALIAKKLLRVNLSDLAAMGATPMVYFLAVMLPDYIDSEWVKRFAEGLKEDQQLFGISLAGGDTTATLGDLSFCVTAMGSVAKGTALKRSTAKAGEDIYVSGTIGDSALGLGGILKELPLKPFLEARYYVPEPRLKLGEKLHGIARAAMDISDGLLQDLGHMCKASGTGAQLEAQRIPLSAAAMELREEPNFWNYVATGGDDYELLFTASSDKAGTIAQLAIELALPLTKIGVMQPGGGVQLLDGSGTPLQFEQQGFQHFGD